jgi:ribosomal protection tetracycline resistance protein
VLEAMLAADYGIPVAFRETTPIYIERPRGAAEALEVMHVESNPFFAAIGFRVEPAIPGSGLDFRLDVDPRTIPLYLYKNVDAFAAHMRGYVEGALRQGLFGWQVSDCVVTMTRCNYSVPDGPPSRRGPLSSAADFRKLTPIVLMQALAAAGTAVCEPIVAARLELPAEAVGAVIACLARLGAAVQPPALTAGLAVVEAEMPALLVRDLQRQLPGLTGGEGVLETEFAGYQPITGQPPTRRRTTANPLNLDAYLSELAGHGRQQPSGGEQ